MSSAAGVFSSPASTDLPAAATSTSTTPIEMYGFSDKTAKLIEKLLFKYQLAESNAGGNDEAKLCLRKCDDDAWGEARDYAGCIRKIASTEAASSVRAPNAAKLRVEAFFAGSDLLIGQGGQRYFERGWQDDEVRASVDFTTSTFKEADHDSVLIDQKKGALKIIFERIANLNKSRD